MEVRKSRLLLRRSQHMNSINVAILLWLSSHPTICPLAPNITLSLSDSTVAGSKEVVTIHVIRIDHHWQGPKPLFKDRKQASKNQEERAWKVGKGKMYKPSQEKLPTSALCPYDRQQHCLDLPSQLSSGSCQALPAACL